MARIKQIDPTAATGKAKELLDPLLAKSGRVSNMLATMADAPAVLVGYLGLSRALSHGTLRGKLREQVALAVSETNGCTYCLAAHTSSGAKMGLTPEEILDARRGQANDPKTATVLTFALAVMHTHGQIADGDLAAVRAAGFTDEEVLEIIANVALMTFSNYTNIVAATELDFPPAEPLPEKAQARP